MNTLSFSKKNSGIAAVAIIVVVVIIIAAVGIAAYVALGNSGSTTGSTQTTTSSATNTAVVSSSTPASSSTSSSSSAASSSSSSLSTSTSSSLSSSSSSESTSMVSSSSNQTGGSTSNSSVTTSFTTTTCSSNFTLSGTTSSPTTTSIIPSGNSYPELLNLFGNFSAMTIQFGNSTTNPGTYSYTSAKQTVNGTNMWVVNFNSSGFSGSSQAENGTIYLLTNGSVAAAIINGQSMSGFELAFAGLVLLPFVIFTTFSTSFTQIVGSQYVTVINQTTIPLAGGMQVTNYGPKTLPFTYTECGNTYTLNQFDIQVGTIRGYTILTYLLFSGTSNGQTGTYFYKVTALTLA